LRVPATNTKTPSSREAAFFVNFPLTVRGGAHISPAPDDDGAAETAPATEASGSRDPEGAVDEGPDPRVVCSMHCLLGKGYAGGGDHEVLRHGLFSSSLVRKFDASWID